MSGVSDILEAYKAIWSLTQGMHQAAKESQWERLIALQAERNALVSYLMSAGDTFSPEDEWNNQIAEMIRNILDCDAETRSLSEAWMAEMRQMLGSIGTEKKLNEAYAGNE